MYYPSRENYDNAEHSSDAILRSINDNESSVEWQEFETKVVEEPQTTEPEKKDKKKKEKKKVVSQPEEPKKRRIHLIFLQFRKTKLERARCFTW